MADENHQLKRRLDNDSDVEDSSKKLCLDVDEENREFFAKILLPSHIVGLIIGKDGVEISSLMSRTNTTIKFSPGRELYPDTQDRVCCISGPIHSIVTTIQAIFDKMSTSDNIQDVEILKSIKMLVSNVSSGIIIGKSGATIRIIQKTFNVRVQISSKDESRGLPERTMVISGESTHSVIAAVKDILIRLLNDPDSERWKKLLSYSSYNITPAATLSTQTTPSHSNSVYSFVSLLQQQQQSQYQTYANLQQSSGAQMASYLQRSQSGASTGSSTDNNSLLTQSLLSYMYSQSLVSNGGYFTRFSPVMVHGVNMSVPGGTLATFEMAIPDVMVSVVLGGSSGSFLAELMHSTGTNMELSAKGDYIPGTYNRKLTITGPVLSVLSAHLSLSQGILREQEAFRKQGLI